MALPSFPPEGAALGVSHLAGGGHIPAAIHSFSQDDQQQAAFVSGAVQEGGVLTARSLVSRLLVMACSTSSGVTPCRAI